MFISHRPKETELVNQWIIKSVKRIKETRNRIISLNRLYIVGFSIDDIRQSSIIS